MTSTPCHRPPLRTACCRRLRRHHWTPNLILVLVALLFLAGLPRLTPAVHAEGGSAPVIPSDDALAVWQHRNVNAVGYDIWYAVFDNDSALGTPLPIPTPLSLTTIGGDDKNPHVNSNGKTIAVWQHAPGTGPMPGDYDIYYSVFFNGVWTAAAPIARLAGDDYDPNVAVDADGRAVAVWVHRSGVNNTAARQMYYSVYNGTTWSMPAAIVPATGNHASLPEITVTSVPGTGLMTARRFVAVWSDLVVLLRDPLTQAPILSEHRMFYSAFNGSSWLPAKPINDPTGVAFVPDVVFSDYLGSDPDPYGAFGRVGITADTIGNAAALWSGGPEREDRPSPGVIGASYAVGSDSWTPLLATGGGRLIGLFTENVDVTATTGGSDILPGDLIPNFSFSGEIWHNFQVAGVFVGEVPSYSSELDDERPSNAALSASEVISVNWGDGELDPVTGLPIGDLLDESDIIFSVGVVTPGPFGGVLFNVLGQRIRLAGRDLFPEVTSLFSSQLATGKARLELSPATGENTVGEPHEVTATVTFNGARQIGVTVNFTVQGSNGSSPSPGSGSCMTDGDGQCTFTYTSFSTGNDTITATAIVNGQNVTATATKRWIASTITRGKMTGGGGFQSTRHVSYGFELRCDPLEKAHFQITWKATNGSHQSFQMDSVLSSACSDTAGIDPGQPASKFDTHKGSGRGKYNNQPGGRADWTLTDAGEPGKDRDSVDLKIFNASGVQVFAIAGRIQKGNHQAHDK
jgi:hypothetical protein